MTTPTEPAPGHDDFWWEPPLAGDDASQLLGSLDRLRATFRWKADGLDAEGLATRVGASTLTIGGLLKHLAFVEENSLYMKVTGKPPCEPWRSADWDADPDYHWNTEGHSPEELYRLYDTAVERSQERVAAWVSEKGLDMEAHISDPGTGQHASLRRILCDLLEEYGRHTGHADLLREQIDGRVGEDPPAGWRPVSYGGQGDPTRGTLRAR